jgi:hypothetical protein
MAASYVGQRLRAESTERCEIDAGLNWWEDVAAADGRSEELSLRPVADGYERNVVHKQPVGQGTGSGLPRGPR